MPLTPSLLPITGLRRLAAETDSTVARTRQFLVSHGCRIVEFAGAECVSLTDACRVMESLLTNGDGDSDGGEA